MSSTLGRIRKIGRFVGNTLVVAALLPLAFCCLVSLQQPFLALLVPSAIFVSWLVFRLSESSAAWEAARKPDIDSENAYAVLGVGQDADLPAIHRAFRQLVLKHHPDAVPTQEKQQATRNFIRLSQAYELLIHEEIRYQYDSMIDELGGEIPPFEEAYERLKDEDKHPIYEDYDALYNPRKLVENAETAGEEARSALPEAQPPAVAGSEQAADEKPESPLEVDMPDAVREALGLPPHEPSQPRPE